MKHKHAELMAAYAADAQTTDKPWELWESRNARRDDYPDNGYSVYGKKSEWYTLKSDPCWNPWFEYRRKTNEQIIHVLLWQAHEQLEEISAEICALNLDGIQDLLAQVRELVKGGEA